MPGHPRSRSLGSRRPSDQAIDAVDPTPLMSQSGRRPGWSPGGTSATPGDCPTAGHSTVASMNCHFLNWAAGAERSKVHGIDPDPAPRLCVNSRTANEFLVRAARDRIGLNKHEEPPRLAKGRSTRTHRKIRLGSVQLSSGDQDGMAACCGVLQVGPTVRGSVARKRYTTAWKAGGWLPDNHRVERRIDGSCTFHATRRRVRILTSDAGQSRGSPLYRPLQLVGSQRPASYIEPCPDARPLTASMPPDVRRPEPAHPGSAADPSNLPASDGPTGPTPEENLSMAKSRKPSAARKPPEPSDSHSEIEDWIRSVMPDLHPVVQRLDELIRERPRASVRHQVEAGVLRVAGTRVDHRNRRL